MNDFYNFFYCYEYLFQREAENQRGVRSAGRDLQRHAQQVLGQVLKQVLGQVLKQVLGHVLNKY
jgi:hypothetical protein